MHSCINVFRRYEKKYLLSEAQAEALLSQAGDRLTADQFPVSTISNLYYDTPEHLLIRRSLEKPVYKEKLRLRSYRRLKQTEPVFLELKKKYRGVVYKRREEMPLQLAMAYLAGQYRPQQETQIERELDWFLHLYPGLAPSMFIYYDRQSMTGTQDEQLRLTFDRNILWRQAPLDLTSPVSGTALLSPGQVLMEVKLPGAMPLWLAHLLDTLQLYPTSFSKYGNAYLSAANAKGAPLCV